MSDAPQRGCGSYEGVTLEGVRLEGLCLDLDDTLLDDSGSVREAWEVVVELAASRRGGLAPEALRSAIARTTSRFWADPERHRWGRLDLPRARHEIVARALSEIGHEDAGVAAEAAALYTEHRSRSLRLIDGVLPVLERLRAAVPRLALVTNGAAAPQRAKIERFRLDRFFDHVQIEGEFGAGKPEARVWHHVLEALGVSAAASLMVGDNFECDVLGPLAVGMHAAWIDPTGAAQPPQPAPRAHLTLRSLHELAARLGC